jgi:hypothetical protein
MIYRYNDEWVKGFRTNFEFFFQVSPFFGWMELKIAENSPGH